MAIEMTAEKQELPQIVEDKYAAGFYSRESVDAFKAAALALVEEKQRVIDNMRLQAQVWASEVDTHQATIQECYAAVGVTGKCDFNGAEPVRDVVAELRAEVERLRKALIESGRNGGALLADDVSTDFLMHVPEQIRLRIAALSEGRKEPK